MNGEHGIADDLDVQAATPSASGGSFDPQDYDRGFGLDEITPANMQSRPYVPSVFCGHALGPGVSTIFSATVVGAVAEVAANPFAAPIVGRRGPERARLVGPVVRRHRPPLGTARGPGHDPNVSTGTIGSTTCDGLTLS